MERLRHKRESGQLKGRVNTQRTCRLAELEAKDRIRRPAVDGRQGMNSVKGGISDSTDDGECRGEYKKIGVNGRSTLQTE